MTTVEFRFFGAVGVTKAHLMYPKPYTFPYDPDLAPAQTLLRVPTPSHGKRATLHIVYRPHSVTVG